MIRAIPTNALPVAALVLLILTLATTITSAKSGEQRLERIADVSVRYDDLNLQSAADASTLLSRIEKAAFRACGGRAEFHRSFASMPNHVTKVFSDCRVKAVERAVAAVNAPKLSHAFAVTYKICHSSDALG